MAHDTRTATDPDLDGLAERRDPDGKKTYLTVYLDLTADDWMQALKDRSEATRLALTPDEATGSNFHHAFDTAFVAAEKVAQKGGQGALVVVSAVHDVEIALPLDQKVETQVVLDVQPDLGPLGR